MNNPKIEATHSQVPQILLPSEPQAADRFEGKAKEILQSHPQSSKALHAEVSVNPNSEVPKSIPFYNNLLDKAISPEEIFKDILPEVFKNRDVVGLNKVIEVLNSDPNHAVTVEKGATFDHFTIKLNQEALNQDGLRDSVQNFFKGTFKRVHVEAGKNIDYKIHNTKQNIVNLAQGIADNLVSLDIRIADGKPQAFTEEDIKGLIDYAPNLEQLKTSVRIPEQQWQELCKDRPNLQLTAPIVHKKEAVPKAPTVSPFSIPSDCTYPDDCATESLSKFKQLASSPADNNPNYNALSQVTNQEPYRLGLGPYEAIYNPTGDGDCGVTAFSFCLVDAMIKRKVNFEELKQKVEATREWFIANYPKSSEAKIILEKNLGDIADWGFDLLISYIELAEKGILKHEDFLEMVEGKRGRFLQHAFNYAVRLVTFSHAKLTEDDDKVRVGTFTEYLVDYDFVAMGKIFGFQIPCVTRPPSSNEFVLTQVREEWEYGIFNFGIHFMVMQRDGKQDFYKNNEDNNDKYQNSKIHFSFKFSLIKDYFDRHFENELSVPNPKSVASIDELNESDRFLLDLLVRVIREKNSILNGNMLRGFDHIEKRDMLELGVKKLNELVGNVPENLESLKMTNEELTAILSLFRLLCLKHVEMPITWGEAKKLIMFQGELTKDLKGKLESAFKTQI